MPNIEIKAKVENLSQLENLAKEIKAKYLGLDHQVDTYFKTKEGRLKLRESSLKNGAYLIPYQRNNTQGPKVSDYTFLTAENPKDAKRLLAEVLGVEVEVDKLRAIYLIDNVRVHLDQVKNLGTFFELEAVYAETDEMTVQRETKKVDELLTYFHIPKVSLIAESYRELLIKNLLTNDKN